METQLLLGRAPKTDDLSIGLDSLAILVAKGEYAEVVKSSRAKEILASSVDAGKLDDGVFWLPEGYGTTNRYLTSTSCQI
jgi:hypothetical protein